MRKKRGRGPRYGLAPVRSLTVGAVVGALAAGATDGGGAGAEVACEEEQADVNVNTVRKMREPARERAGWRIAEMISGLSASAK
jgi:hypothetical protein